MTKTLQATAFRGDPDLDELHSFFLPETQFDGDTLWSFGTSLKSAYVNSFEFMNHAPVLQLWRDDRGEVQAVSRISLGTGEWFHLAAPAYRTDRVTRSLIDQADAAFMLLSERGAWETVRYESKVREIHQLEQSGYTSDGVAEVYMVRSLEEPVDDVPSPTGIDIELLDPSSDDAIRHRALAQVDAFTDAEPTEREVAWITRSLPHQLSYGKTSVTQPQVIAVDAAGRVASFADVFVDRKNRIGEFEPVGTRKSDRQIGLGKAVLARGLREMVKSGMSQAVVRTGFDNPAAIAAYESVGFVTTDHLIRFRKQRQR